jgi:hypothetical protein
MYSILSVDSVPSHGEHAVKRVFKVLSSSPVQLLCVLLLVGVICYQAYVMREIRRMNEAALTERAAPKVTVPENALERADTTLRPALTNLDEGTLLYLMARASADKMNDMEDPEIPVRQAHISEALTKYRPAAWNRACWHYAEAIELYQKLEGQRDIPFIKKRMHVLRMAFQDATEKAGKPNQTVEDVIKQRQNFFKTLQKDD